MQTPELRLPIVSGLILLCFRGVLLWTVIPVGILCWSVGWPLWRRQRVGLGQLLGWADLNLDALLYRSVVLPFVRRHAR